MVAVRMGCKNTTCSFQSARTRADHQQANTILIRFRNILLVEPTLQVCLQAPFGEHTRGEEIMGKLATAQTWSVWTRIQVQHALNMPDLLRLSSAQPLATRMVSSATSTWLLSRPTDSLYGRLLAGSCFLPTGSTGLKGKGASKTFWCQPRFLSATARLERLLLGTIIAHAKLGHCYPWWRHKLEDIIPLPKSCSFIFHVFHSGTYKHKFSSQGNWQAVLHPRPVVTDLSSCIPGAWSFPLHRLLQLSHKLPPLLYPSCKTRWIFWCVD